ncbi:MAG TPA: hypothetical protein VM430_11850, partial [Microbacterium sp.]|nr:hypothetical protein [Microbacterium sp.]
MRAARRSRRSGAAFGWATGIIVIALFGAGGAAVASGQMEGLISTAQPAQSASVAPSTSSTPFA